MPGHDTAAPELLTCVSGLGNAAGMVGTVPETMRAAVYKGDRRAEVEDYRVPDLGPEDALPKVSNGGSAAPTSTSCSRAGAGRTRSAATSTPARSPPSVPT